MARKRKKHDITFESPLRFMSYDVSNSTGRARLAVVNPAGEELTLDLSRVVITSPTLPKDFDPSLFELTGGLSISITIKEK